MLYSREDVTARPIANGYSQYSITIFSQEMKPYEVELLLAQVGETAEDNELYRITLDGSIIDERMFTAIGDHSQDNVMRFSLNTLVFSNEVGSQTDS